jgi:hypothetical protein
MRSKTEPTIPFPSLVGTAVIVKQAVLLTQIHRAPAPSQNHRFSGVQQAAPLYSGGTVPVLHRTSLLSPKWAPVSYVIANRLYPKK